MSRRYFSLWPPRGGQSQKQFHPNNSSNRVFLAYFGWQTVSHRGGSCVRSGCETNWLRCHLCLWQMVPGSNSRSATTRRCRFQTCLPRGIARDAAVAETEPRLRPARRCLCVAVNSGSSVAAGMSFPIQLWWKHLILDSYGLEFRQGA